MQPSDLTNEPEPLRPENLPVLVQLKPCTDPPVRVAPLGLTDPELSSPDTEPPEMTNRSVLLPQGVPEATATHVPSKLPPPLPFVREARRGSSDSDFARRAGLDGSAARGFSRVPDSDFSSLPMLPPALPDCAIEATGESTAVIRRAPRAILIEHETIQAVMSRFPSFKARVPTPTIVSPRSRCRCSHPIAETSRRRCGRRGVPS